MEEKTIKILKELPRKVMESRRDFRSLANRLEKKSILDSAGKYQWA